MSLDNSFFKDEKDDLLINSEDNNKQWVKLELLGQGQYGEVFKTKNLNTGAISAIKKIKNIYNNENGVNYNLLREIIILKNLDHKNIVKLKDVAEKFGYFYLIFEYLKENLYEFIKEFSVNGDNNLECLNDLYILIAESKANNIFNINYEDLDSDYKLILNFFFTTLQLFYNYVIQYIFKELLLSLKYIHMKKIIHRDLKPSNILISYKDKSLRLTLLKYYMKIVINMYHLNKVDNNIQFEKIILYQMNLINKYYEKLNKEGIIDDKKVSNFVVNSSDNKNEDSSIIDEMSNFDNLKIYNVEDIIYTEFYKECEHFDIEENIIIKIADFGLSRLQSENNINFTLNMVTLWYRPPELLNYIKNYNEKIDIWSLGCIFVEILIKEPLFKGSGEVVQLIKINELITDKKIKSKEDFDIIFFNVIRKKNVLINDYVYDLLANMLCYDQLHRESAKCLLKKEFLNINFI